MCKDKAEEKKEQFLEMFSPEERDKVEEFFDDDDNSLDAM